MRRFLVLVTLVLAGAVHAPHATAGIPADVTAIDFEPNRSRTLASSIRNPFTLVGVHWRGSGRVAFRTRSLGGAWSRWRPAAPEAEDAPDPDSPESTRRNGWHVGNPWWVGPSDRVEVRRVGRVARVRVYLVWSPAAEVPIRVPAATETPAIVPRLSWGASESIRRSPPLYAREVRFAVVHHTAGRNGYTRAEAPAIVKAIQLYHVQGNGWNDIGYNFLVDRFGTIYEGRFGGVEKNVVGAHAAGFNTGSTGVALLGTYGDAAPSRAAEDALSRLLAWRLDLAHVDPSSTLTVLSGGNERYAVDVPVRLRAVSGHRDTGSTACPGNSLYGRLGSLADAATRLGGPKIFEPRVEASGEGPVRFLARVSSAIPWAVVVTLGGAEVARGSGTGTKVDWTWDASSAPTGTYAWSIIAGSARPATGSVRAGFGTTELAIEEMTSFPEGITPNGDGQGDTAQLTFSLSTPANLTVEVTDATGVVAATLLDRVWKRAGSQTFIVDGAALPDGLYNVVVRAYTASTSEVVQMLPLTVSRTLGLVTVSPEVFSPNGDGRNDRLDVRFGLAAPATVNVRILRDGHWVAAPLVDASLPAGPQGIFWDGSRSEGRLQEGAFSAVVSVTDSVGTVSFGLPFASDTVAPRARILPTKRPSRTLRIAVSEPALLKLWINGTSLRREVGRVGTVAIRWPEHVRRARVVAWDAGGNVSVPAVMRASSKG